MLDARPVVPGPVEQHDLARRRQLVHVPLEVPLRLLAFRRRRQCRDPRHPGVEILGDPLDRASFARRVAALEDHHHPRAGLARPSLQLHQLGLQPVELLLIALPRHSLGTGLAVLGLARHPWTSSPRRPWQYDLRSRVGCGLRDGRPGHVLLYFIYPERTVAMPPTAIGPVPGPDPRPWTCGLGLELPAV